MFGTLLKVAWNVATDAARGKASDMMQSAADGYQAAKSSAVEGYQATKRAVTEGYHVARQAATDAKDAAVADAGKVARASGRVATFGGRAGSEVANTVYQGVRHPFDSARKVFGTRGPPANAGLQQCPRATLDKNTRIQQRLDLIASGAGSNDPAVRTAAARLAENNEAVELAKLSCDTYDRFPDTGKMPPEGWEVVTAKDMSRETAALLQDSRAVVYRTAPGWPGGPKTVVAFRGTADMDDVIVDYRQAMSTETVQYRSAIQLANAVKAEPWGNDVLATGHSLGGGKAQAFAGVSGARGMGFNAAGPHPDVVQMLPDSEQMVQYRTEFDPLTGTQNSAALQTLAAAAAGLGGTLASISPQVRALIGKKLGVTSEDGLRQLGKEAANTLPQGARNLLSNGGVIPPAIGRIHEVPAIANDGRTYGMFSGFGADQHSIISVINGIEQQKQEDTAILTKAGGK